MPNTNKTYTYRCGEKIELDKSSDEIVVRALPDSLIDVSIDDTEQVSSASTKIKVSASELEGLMERSRNTAPTHHAYYESESGSEFLITDRIFVTFKDSLTDAQVDEFSGRYGLMKLATYSDKDYLFQLTNHTGMNPLKLVVKLMEEEALVQSAGHDLNQRMWKYEFTPPIDPDYARQWHLHTDLNHVDYDQRSCSMSENAWRLLDGFGSDEVVIAVTDDGCKLDHFDFDSSNKFASWGYLRGTRLITAVDIDADPVQMYKTGSDHGTSCCGVIAGELDAVLTVGAAPACQLLPIQWESSGPSLFISDSKLLTTLNYISDKADVMSNSWGSVPNSMWELQVVNRIRELAITGGRRGKGIVFLWAAGNENCLINHTANQDVPFTDGFVPQGNTWVWGGVRTTRRFRNNFVGIPGLMHIAALASTAMRSHYSNYGPGIGLCAPTSNSHAYHRATVRGLGVTTATGPSPSGVTNSFGGTSSATPLVAGIAALIISANPNLSALEVISILKETASKDLDFSEYAKTPPASFDLNPSWDVSPVAPFDNGQFTDSGDAEGSWSPWFGHGCVDAEAAVAEAINRLAVPADNTNFNKSSTPNASIPDADVIGISDQINCNADFLLSSIKVSIDIAHTYIGDLVVSLSSPSGSTVVLHNRNGGGRNNLQATYDTSNVPNLTRFLDEQVIGDWTLQVQDLAGQDIGNLVSWSLDLSGQSGTLIFKEDTQTISIPDDSAIGIERSISVLESGSIDQVKVDLDITHTYIGDLIVELKSPSDTSIFLHNRSGGSADNLIKSYTLQNTSALQNLRGETVTGTWTLKVSDHAGVDQGKLNGWSIQLGAL